MTAIRKNIIQGSFAIAAAVIGVFFVYQMHFQCGKISMFGNYTPTQDKIDNEINHRYFDDVLSYHKSEPSFKRRLLTTYLLDKSMRAFDWKSGTAFLIINFSLLFLCGLVLYFLAFSFTTNNWSSFFSVLIFYTSITIATAFYATNYTYDEPMQYLLLVVALLAYKKNWLLIFLLFFTGAIMARESSLLILPSLILVFYNNKKYRFLLALASSVLLYFLYQHFFLGALFAQDNVAYQSTRFDLLKLNFETKGRSLESILSAFVVAGVASYYFLFRKTVFKDMRIMFLVSIVINTLIVWTLTNASEMRLFALPLLFFWPIAGAWLCSFKPRRLSFNLKATVNILLSFSALIAGVYLTLAKYTTTYLPIQYSYNKQYVILTLMFLFVCELYRVGTKNNA